MSKKGCKWNNCPNYATTFVDMGNRQVPACGGCKRGSMTPKPQANTNPTKSCSLDEIGKKLHKIFDDVYIQPDTTFIDVEVEKEITDKILTLITQATREARIDEVKKALSFTTMDDLKNRLTQLEENK